MISDIFCPPVSKKFVFLFFISAFFPLFQVTLGGSAESSDKGLIEDQERACLNPYHFLNDEIKGDTVTLNRVEMTDDDICYLNLALGYEDQTLGFKRQKKQRSIYLPFNDTIDDFKKNVLSSENQAYFIIRTRHAGVKQGTMELSYYLGNPVLNSLIPPQLKNEFYDNNALNVNFMFPAYARDIINESCAIETLINYTIDELAPYGRVRVLTTFVNPEDTQTIDVLRIMNFHKVNAPVFQDTPDLYKNRDLYVWKHIQNTLSYSSHFLGEPIVDDITMLERSTQEDAEFIAWLYNNDDILRNQAMTRKKTVIKQKHLELLHLQQIHLLLSVAANYYETLAFAQKFVIRSGVYLSFTVKDPETHDSLGYLQVGYLKFCPNARTQIPGRFQGEINQLNAMKISLMMDPAVRDLQTETRAFKTFITYLRLTRSLPERSVGDIKALTSLVFPKDVITYKALLNCGFIDKELTKKDNKRHFLIRYL